MGDTPRRPRMVVRWVPAPPLTSLSFSQRVKLTQDLSLSRNRHILTGTGAYFYIVWGIWLRHCLNGRQEEYDLIWPTLFSLPEVVRLDQRADRFENRKTR